MSHEYANPCCFGCARGTGCEKAPPAANDNIAQAADPTIFFDMDGVLANFDKGAERALGTDNIYRYEFVYGQEEFWKGLNASPGFFLYLEEMPGAGRMVHAVRHHPLRILTALPNTGADAVDRDKRSWAGMNFPGIPVITCLTHEKPDYCKPGDVLIDDRAVNKAKWEAKGGRFIVHTDVGSTLAQLKSMGLTK